MTDPLPNPIRPSSPPLSSGAESPSGRMTPNTIRRRKKAQPTHTFHLNIGRVEVPRSLPPTRTIGTQTDESATSFEAEKNKAWYRRALAWGDKWAMPVLRAGASVLALLIGRIGFGFRIN